MAQVNWNLMTQQLGGALTSGLQGLLEGAAEDIEAFANAIAAEMTLALSTGDDNAVRELKAQIGVIAEVNRVRVARSQESAILNLIGVAVNVATGSLLAAGAQVGGA